MKKEFNQDFWTDFITMIVALGAICTPVIAIGWFLLKVAKGVFYLLDKLIDKI